MNNLWDGLEERLKEVVNNKINNNSGCEGTAIIYINLIYTQDDKLAGWYKPQRVPLEPRAFNISALLAGKKRLSNWQSAIEIMKETKAEYNNNLRIATKALVVLDGLPVGFLDSLD